MTMKVAIMGCGPGGSYLYILLRQRRPELEVNLFDIPHNNPCGIKGCGWVVSYPEFSSLCREVGLNPKEFTLGLHKQAFIQGVKVKASLAVINKPLFIKQMLAGRFPEEPSAARLNDYERIVDATGAQRAYLSPHSGPLIFTTFQTKISLNSSLPPQGFLNYGGGYTWVIPLSSGEAHLGSFSPYGLEAARREVERTRQKLRAGPSICACQTLVRCHGPLLPFIEGRIWGLGEAIGLVDPVVGVGIVPAMISAKLMVENWNRPQDYERQVWSRYSYMVREAKMLLRLGRKRQKPSWWDLLCILLTRKIFHTIGLYPGLRELINLRNLVRI